MTPINQPSCLWSYWMRRLNHAMILLWLSLHMDTNSSSRVWQDTVQHLQQQRDTLYKYYEEYNTLHDTLQQLPNTTKKSIMVPLSQVAFIPGYIYHTNEIMVLLGENYFAKRTTKQATEIIARRQQCEFRHVSADLKRPQRKYSELGTSAQTVQCSCRLA